MEQRQFLQQIALEQLDSLRKEKKKKTLDTDFTLSTKINSEWIIPKYKIPGR